MDRIANLLDEAISYKGAARAAYLRTLTIDEETSIELGALVAAYENAPTSIETPLVEFRNFLDKTRFDFQEESSDDKLIGRQIGDFRIVRRIAAGGMGTVFEALQDNPHRAVALKVLHQGLMDNSGYRRFEHEAYALALLQHPNIAQVFGAGTVEINNETLPYFALELVDGVPYIQYAFENNISIRERVKLFVKIAKAIHHAHQKGVIHRDLKPDNILVNSVGEPKVLDFGVARITNIDIQSATLQTSVGQLIGTLAYMSPEQASGNPDEVDIRSDVYVLGVNLFQLLTGQVPCVTKGKMIHEVVQDIREQQAPRLSSLDSSLKGDLETIVAKAMEKDKEHRYQSALSLVDDLQRFLIDEPILASPPSGAYRLKKFVRRNRASVSAGAIVLLALIVTTAVSITFAVSEATHRGFAEKATQTAKESLLLAKQREVEIQSALVNLETVVDFQSSMLSGVDLEEMGRNIFTTLSDRVLNGLTEQGVSSEQLNAVEISFDKLNSTDIARQILDQEFLVRAVKTIERNFSDQPLLEATLRFAVGGTYLALGLYPQALPQLELTLAIRRRELGGEHEQTLIAINYLGVLFIQMGKYAEALAFSREAMETSQRVLGKDDPLTLTCIDNLGSLYNNMGKHSDALQYYLEALEARRRIFGNEHIDTVTSIINLSGLLDSMGSYDEALRYSNEALDNCRRFLDRDHPKTLNSINLMGSILMSMGNHAEALPYYVESLDGHRRILGNDHPNTLNSINNLSSLLATMGKHSEALPYFQEALEGNRRVLGNDHPSTLISIGNTGATLAKLGRLEEALKYDQEALKAKRRILGNIHESTLVSIHNMGYLLRWMKRYDEAITFCREALEGRRRVLGNNHPHTISSINNMGGLLNLMGKYNEALPYYREAMEIQLLTKGNTYTKTLSSINNLGYLLLKLGLHQEAVTLLGENENAARRVWEDDNLRWLGNYLTKLGEARIHIGEFEKAESTLLEAYEILSSSFGENHKRTTKCNIQLVDLYTAWHDNNPDGDYNTYADEWREKLPQPETSSKSTE